MNRCPHCGQNHSNTNHFCPVTGKPIELGPRLLSVKLLNRFKVVQILGEGPIGIVVEVEDKNSQEHFAAKLIHPQYTRDPESAKNLISEVEKLKEVQCEHIAKVVTVGRDTGAAISVVRELMTGHCLSTRIQQVGQFSMRAAFFIIREILLGLDAIHSVGILNLDLTPADVFLAKSSTGSTVKMVDIGEHHIKKGLSKNQVSYQYFAPEQLDPSRQPSAKADIYAAGAILYEMLTGAPPSGETVPIDQARKDVIPSVTELVTKAIDSNPARRFDSAKEFISAIDKANEELTAIGSQPPAAAAKATTAPEENAAPSAAPIQVAQEYQQEAAAHQAPITQGDHAETESSEGGSPAEETISTGQAASPVGPNQADPPHPAAPDTGIETNAAAAPQPGTPSLVNEPNQSQPPQPADASVPGMAEQPSPQASVIVEMPEIDSGLKSRKSLIAIVVLLVLAALATGYFLNEKTPTTEPETAVPEEVEITIEVVPQHAVIDVDGNRMQGNPVSMKVKLDGRLHTIQAKADGYEQKERDIRFDKTRTIQLDLAEIIQPDEPESPAGTEEEAAAAIQEVEAAPPEPAKPAITAPKPKPAANKAKAATPMRKASKSATGKRASQKQTAKKAKSEKTNTQKSRSSTSSKSKTTKKSGGKSTKTKGFTTSNPFD